MEVSRAVVIGAGIGGLCATAALAGSFDEVVLIERDPMPETPEVRAGVPQARHPHNLLAGGLRALEDLLPGLSAQIQDAGSVPLVAGVDIRLERPGFDPYPQRDLGFRTFGLSRPLLEWLLHSRVKALRGVRLQEGCRVKELLRSADGSRAKGVRYEAADCVAMTLDADLVVDASGRGALYRALLRATGHAEPAETVIGLDIGYATAIFAKPTDAPVDWKGLAHAAQAPQTSRCAWVIPIENERWFVALGGRGDEKPPADLDGFLAFLKSLRTPTAYEAVRNARLETDPVRFAFPEAYWRHFARLDELPRGALPFGDAICRLNPVFGHGMSVAASQACALRDLLARPGPGPEPLDGLEKRFLSAADSIIEAPWNMAALLDLALPQTVGERPPDLAARLQYGAALARLGAADPELHRLSAEVQNLLKPPAVLAAPEIAARVKATMETAR